MLRTIRCGRALTFAPDKLWGSASKFWKRLSVFQITGVGYLKKKGSNAKKAFFPARKQKWPRTIIVTKIFSNQISAGRSIHDRSLYGRTNFVMSLWNNFRKLWTAELNLMSGQTESTAITKTTINLKALKPVTGLMIQKWARTRSPRETCSVFEWRTAQTEIGINSCTGGQPH